MNQTPSATIGYWVFWVALFGLMIYEGLGL